MHGKWLILTIAFMALALPDALPSTINLHSSFHISFKENINYYVVKFYSNQTIYIDEIHVKIEARRAGTQWFSTNKILIINFENNESLMPPEFYRKLKRKGKHENVAIIGAARKLLQTIYGFATNRCIS